MRKIIVFFVFAIATLGVVLAAPKSTIFLSAGPSFSTDGLNLTSSVEMNLEFWVAHVESYFSVNTNFANNTLIFTPYASQLFKYVDFDWGGLRIQDGATDTHSEKFYTLWDVGTLPFGWTVTLKGETQNSTLSFAYDRGTYFARFNGFFYLDSFWYQNGFLLTGRLGNFFLMGGVSNGAYGIGLSANYGNFSNTLMAFSDSVDLFPNIVHQAPSKYVWIFDYTDGSFSALTAMTEKELHLQGEVPFNIFDGNATITFSGYYVGGYQPSYGISGSFQFVKPISKDISFFLDAATSGQLLNVEPVDGPVLWSGLTWRF